MQPPSTAAAYDLLAERWRDETFDGANGMRQHERALAFLKVQEKDGEEGGWALSVGCGCNTRFNPPLRARGLQLEGVDVSARMIDLAAQADPDVVLHHADVCTWPLPRRYRLISAWDSLWHVRLEQQRALMRKLMDALAPGGIFIFSTGGLDSPDEHVDATMGMPVYYATLGIPGLLDVIAQAGCVCRHLEFDQYPERHLFVIVQRQLP